MAPTEAPSECARDNALLSALCIFAGSQLEGFVTVSLPVAPTFSGQQRGQQGHWAGRGWEAAQARVSLGTCLVTVPFPCSAASAGSTGSQDHRDTGGPAGREPAPSRALRPDQGAHSFRIAQQSVLLGGGLGVQASESFWGDRKDRLPWENHWVLPVWHVHSCRGLGSLRETEGRVHRRALWHRIRKMNLIRLSGFVWDGRIQCHGAEPQ